jgi:hypothetical protein
MRTGLAPERPTTPKLTCGQQRIDVGLSRTHIQAMTFTLSQVRSVVGLSTETYRHWRRTLPCLAARSGRAARFSFGDLVALALLRCAIDDLGLSVSQFAGNAKELFDTCTSLSWVGTTGVQVLVTRKSEIAEPLKRRPFALISVEIAVGMPASFIEPTVVIPLDPIADKLRQLLFSAADLQEDQFSLPLPPVALAPQRPGQALQASEATLHTTTKVSESLLRPAPLREHR